MPHCRRNLGNPHAEKAGARRTRTILFPDADIRPLEQEPFRDPQRKVRTPRSSMPQTSATWQARGREAQAPRHGQCHRKNTARTQGRARVKRRGKSPPRGEQSPRQDKPHAVQDRTGAHGSFGQSPTTCGSGVPGNSRTLPRRAVREVSPPAGPREMVEGLPPKEAHRIRLTAGAGNSLAKAGKADGTQAPHAEAVEAAGCNPALIRCESGGVLHRQRKVNRTSVPGPP